MAKSRVLSRSVRGFTLPELLVTITIMAALAAMLAPSLSRNIHRSQANRVVSDIQAVSEGIRSFYSNTDRWPARLEQLETAPATDGTAPSLVSGTFIPGELAEGWRGPYLRIKNLSDPVPTGFSAVISDSLTAESLGGSRYVTITVTNLASDQFATVDTIFDSGNGSAAGTLRYDAGSATMKFYMTPID
jgi:prepilin-type N-terminal cleavage/methylation domain-containing protein